MSIRNCRVFFLYLKERIVIKNLTNPNQKWLGVSGMKHKGFLLFLFILLISGCNFNQLKGQMDTPIEYLPYVNTEVTEDEYDQLVSFLREAEMMMKKPVQDAIINRNGIKVFDAPIQTKNDLFEFYQVYLSDELANTLARKVSDLSKSMDGQYLAVSDTNIEWLSIEDAAPNSIRVVQHTNVQSVIEMDIEADRKVRLQYTIMKDQFGENPKIVQKTVWYE